MLQENLGNQTYNAEAVPEISKKLVSLAIQEVTSKYRKM
jgi:hypothetical protein